MAAGCRALVYMVAVLLVSAMPVRGQAAASPIERHCEFTMRLLALTDAEWRERTAATHAYVTDRQQLMTVLDAIGGRHLQLRAALYVSNATTPVEHGRFATDNKEEIATYLKEQAALQAEMTATKARIAASISECERVMAVAAGRRP